jgi:microcystin-dependent protein
MEGTLGEVRLFAGNFAPRQWAMCDGTLLPINDYSALFSVLGTIYGGDGRTTFALPDLRSRIPIGAGDGPGLPPYKLGQRMTTVESESGDGDKDIFGGLAMNWIICVEGLYPSRN